MTANMQVLFQRFENALFDSALDELRENSSERRMKERYDAMREARKNLIAAIERAEQQADTTP